MEEETDDFQRNSAFGQPDAGQLSGRPQNWVDLQEEFNTYYCVVDMRYRTIRQEPPRSCANGAAIFWP